MRHNPVGGGQNDLTELTTRQEVNDPLFDFLHIDIESWGDDTAFVEASVELDDNLLGTVIVDDFEFANISVLLHALQELDNNLTRGSDKYLALTALFGVCDCLQTIGENGHAHHLSIFFLHLLKATMNRYGNCIRQIQQNEVNVRKVEAS
mmetsp:Transcript_11885/g.25326  ORF Transcript_11885/g.25326 Transcript_11885/m.25326 type:complete len:150 (+) Transcript_11885:155-604(+)